MFVLVHLCFLIIKKSHLIIVEGPAQGFKNTTETAEAEYSVNFTKERKKL